MLQTLLIGVSAGAAAALLFASVASGSLLSFPLFYLTPLPILIAALGWSHLSGLVAAVVAATALAGAFGQLFFLAFFVAIGLPAWWLGYLAMLARPAGNAGALSVAHSTTGPNFGGPTFGGPPPLAGAAGLQWYPAGGLVFWAAILAGVAVALAIPQIGTDADSFQATLRGVLERILRMQSDAPADAPLQVPGLASPQALLDFLVEIMPPSAAVMTTITNVLTLWMAARVVAISGRLRRPWPDISAMRFPPYAVPLLLGATVAAFLPDLLGIIGTVLLAALLTAYALLGLAVLHALTRRVNGRGLILSSIYAAIAVFGWPMVVIAFLGLADTALDLRGRSARRRPPPPPA